MVLTAHATTKQYLVAVFQTDFFHHLCDEAKVLPERLQDPAEEEDVVEAGQGDQQEVEGVAHVWKRCEKRTSSTLNDDRRRPSPWHSILSPQ